MLGSAKLKCTVPASTTVRITTVSYNLLSSFSKRSPAWRPTRTRLGGLGWPPWREAEGEAEVEAREPGPGGEEAERNENGRWK